MASENGVYYREVAATTADTVFAVLKDDQVTVKTDVTKAQLEAVKNSNEPTLTFTAYAVQKDNITDVTTAWEKAQTAASNTSGNSGTGEAGE